jgi:hypothetical protein
MSKVRMVNSVGEYEAGTDVDLPEEEADRFLILGYATGQSLSREYTDEEREQLLATRQEVSI